MPRASFWFFGRFMCLGVTESFSMLNLYCVTYDMVSRVSNLGSRSSAPISIFLRRDSGGSDFRSWSV